MNDVGEKWLDQVTRVSLLRWILHPVVWVYVDDDRLVLSGDLRRGDFPPLFLAQESDLVEDIIDAKVAVDR